MYFHGFMTGESQLNEIEQSFSERAQVFISCVFCIWEREKRSCCHASWYHSLAIDLSLFPRCAIYGVEETSEMNTTVSHLGCAATTQTAVLELRFSDQQLSGHSLDPGTETETTLGRPPSDTILGTSLRIQTFYLTGSVSTLEHKYSSPESGSV